jgi:hypothetical protein
VLRFANHTAKAGGWPRSEHEQKLFAIDWSLLLHGQNPARCSDVDSHRVPHVQEKCAGVLQPPGNVGNNEVGPGGRRVSCRLHWQGQCDGMIGSVQSENAFDLHTGVSLKFDFTRQLGGGESDLRKALALEDFLMHFVVTPFVSAAAAGSVDYDNAADRSGGWVEANRPTLECESPVNCMESSRQSELDPGVGWIKFKRHLLGAKRLSAQTKSTYEQADK